MKKLLIICALALVSCTKGTKGVNLTFIKEQFDLPSGNPIIINLDDAGVCPTIEFNSNNSDSFFIRISPTEPGDEQAEFFYKDDEFRDDDEIRTLVARNESGSSFELTFDGDVTYTLMVDYTCIDPDDSTCLRTTYNCSGEIVD